MRKLLCSWQMRVVFRNLPEINLFESHIQLAGHFWSRMFLSLSENPQKRRKGACRHGQDTTHVVVNMRASTGAHMKTTRTEGTSRPLSNANIRTIKTTSSFHLPPISMTNTTNLHRPGVAISDYVDSLSCLRLLRPRWPPCNALREMISTANCLQNKCLGHLESCAATLMFVSRKKSSTFLLNDLKEHGNPHTRTLLQLKPLQLTSETNEEWSCPPGPWEHVPMPPLHCVLDGACKQQSGKPIKSSSWNAN